MATIKDIARRVGVSTCTVSRYINGKIVVKKETAQKIDQAIIDLDYHKNYMAVSLKTQKSTLIALVIPTLKNIFFAGLAGRLAELLEEEGYTMVTFTTRNSLEEECQTCEKLLQLGIAGAIFMTLPFHYDRSDHIHRLESHKIVCLMLNRFFSPSPFATVATDFYQGALLSTHCLLEAGAKRPGLIVGAKDHDQSDLYRRGFMDALAARGLDLEEEQVQYGYFSNKKTEAVVEKLLDGGADGLVGISDFVALMARDALTRRSKSAPQDFLLVGSGNTRFSQLLGITSLDSRVDELSRQGAGLMVDILEGEKKRPFISIAPRLVERASTDRTKKRQEEG